MKEPPLPSSPEEGHAGGGGNDIPSGCVWFDLQSLVGESGQALQIGRREVKSRSRPGHRQGQLFRLRLCVLQGLSMISSLGMDRLTTASNRRCASLD